MDSGPREEAERQAMSMALIREDTSIKPASWWRPQFQASTRPRPRSSIHIVSMSHNDQDNDEDSHNKPLIAMQTECGSTAVAGHYQSLSRTPTNLGPDRRQSLYDKLLRARRPRVIKSVRKQRKCILHTGTRGISLRAQQHRAEMRLLSPWAEGPCLFVCFKGSNCVQLGLAC